MSITATLIGKTVGIIAGVGIGGLGAYNFMTTGCVTGMGCSSGAEATTASLVSQERQAPACHADEANVQTVAAEAPACHAEEANVQTVAAEAPACHAEEANVQTVAAEAPACHAEEANVQTVAAEAPACHAEEANVQTVAAEVPDCSADKASCSTKSEVIAEGDSAAVISSVSLDSTEKTAEQCEKDACCDAPKATEAIATTAANNE